MKNLDYLFIVILGGALNIKRGDQITYAGDPKDFEAVKDRIEKEGWVLDNAMVISPDNKTYCFIRELAQDKN